MLGPDLAEMFGVTGFRLNEVVKRNPGRFPENFCFQLAREELARLTSQIAMPKPPGRGGRRTLPYVFTEHGAIMLASVLNSPRAEQMSVYIVRAFVRLRAMVANDGEQSSRMDELERRIGGHDQTLQVLVAAIRQLVGPPSAPPEPPRPRIGFSREDRDLQS